MVPIVTFLTKNRTKIWYCGGELNGTTVAFGMNNLCITAKMVETRAYQTHAITPNLTTAIGSACAKFELRKLDAEVRAFKAHTKAHSILIYTFNMRTAIYIN